MKQSLRIVFVTNNYTPFAGGVVRSIQATKQELEKLGHTVFIITLDFTGQPESEQRVFRVPSILRFTYKNNHMAIAWRPDYQVKKLIADLKPDIIHSHHPWLLGNSALKAARSLNIPIVFTFHTMYEAYAHYIPLPERLTRYIARTLIARYCNAVDRIIAPSSTMVDYIRSLGIKTPIDVIASGINPLFIHDQFALKKSLADRTIALLCVSRFVPEKNVSALLDVMNQLKKTDPKNKYELFLIGYGAQLQNLKNYAQHLNLNQTDVHFSVKPEQSIIARAYQDADLFLFSSHTDTQALVLAEAMASGTPVIALDGPGQRSIIKQGRNGFIVENENQMIQKIVQIVHDQSLFQNLQKESWRTAHDYYPEKTVAKLESCYRSVLNQTLT